MDTRSLHYISQQRCDKISIFEVKLIVCRERRVDAASRYTVTVIFLSLSLSLSLNRQLIEINAIIHLNKLA